MSMTILCLSTLAPLTKCAVASLCVLLSDRHSFIGVDGGLPSYEGQPDELLAKVQEDGFISAATMDGSRILVLSRTHHSREWHFSADFGPQGSLTFATVVFNALNVAGVKQVSVTVLTDRDEEETHEVVVSSMADSLTYHRVATDVYKDNYPRLKLPL